jgi:tetratricopeptide (TPR) repeat protein
VAALGLFEDIAGRDPGDIEARLRTARLKFRVGRTQEAETDFRSVIAEHPKDIDARIGLGATLTRKGQWAEAQAILEEVEREAPANADLLAALARAFRRGSDDRRALEYFSHAKALAPNDPDVVEGYEAALRSNGHQIQFEGFGDQQASPELVAAVSKEIGATPEQSAGTAGALFGIAKSKLAPNQFSQVAQAVPGMDLLLKAAPAQQRRFRRWA